MGVGVLLAAGWAPGPRQLIRQLFASVNVVSYVFTRRVVRHHSHEHPPSLLCCNTSDQNWPDSRAPAGRHHQHHHCRCCPHAIAGALRRESRANEQRTPVAEAMPYATVCLSTHDNRAKGRVPAPQQWQQRSARSTCGAHVGCSDAGGALWWHLCSRRRLSLSVS